MKWGKSMVNWQAGTENDWKGKEVTHGKEQPARETTDDNVEVIYQTEHESHFSQASQAEEQEGQNATDARFADDEIVEPMHEVTNAESVDEDRDSEMMDTDVMNHEMNAYPLVTPQYPMWIPYPTISPTDYRQTRPEPYGHHGGRPPVGGFGIVPFTGGLLGGLILGSLVGGFDTPNPYGYPYGYGYGWYPYGGYPYYY